MKAVPRQRTSDPRTRRSQIENSRAYDRLARFYRFIEPLYLIFPPARRRAVAALGVRPGATVLEIGAGTGRNFRYLIEAVGPTGTILAVDASPGMLAEAQRLIDQNGWSNIELLCQDASRLEIDREVDGVLFSLSYSAIPDPGPALSRGWERLRPGGSVVVMDLGLPDTRLGHLLGPIGRLLVKLTPGDAYSDPWSDLAVYGPVQTSRFLFSLFYVVTTTKD